jgi:choline kinase
MKAIILAAGSGTRITGTTLKPKALIEVGGISLLQRQIDSLRRANVNGIVVVVGFQGDSIRREQPDGVRFIENKKFAETSSLYSLWLAREHLTEGFVVLNSDVLFHPQLLADLLNSPHENALLISYCRDNNQRLGGEEMKVKVRDEVVVDISKEMDPLTADGENVGIVKFGSAGAKLLISYLDDLIARGFVDAWAPRAFLEFARLHRLHAVSTNGWPWIEIDFPEDYRKAVREVFPRIELLS